jgi:Flp pilus assembly pilin Flp
MFTAMRLFQTWLQRDDGQDLTEYSLLLAFMVVVTAALFLYNGSAVATIWTSASSCLAEGTR